MNRFAIRLGSCAGSASMDGMRNNAIPRRFLIAALVLFSFASVSTLNAANIFAQWNFDDPANTTSSSSNVGGFVGTFFGVAGRTAAGGGVSSTGGDYALDVRALGDSANGAMVVNSNPFLTGLNATTAGQAISLSYWQFLDSTPNSTSFWGNAPSVVSNPGRGLNAHSPWGDGNLYFDTAGCCDGTNRIFNFLGATLGQWQHISLVYNNGSREAYLNDVLVASGTGGVPLPNDFDGFFVGNDFRIATLGMDAQLDNFTIWNGALTSTEISALSVRPTIPEPALGIGVALGAVIASLRRSRRSC